MITPKPVQGLRIQTLQANSPNTPLRRRSALNVSNLHSASPQLENSRHINDDEEERRNSRRFDSFDSATNLAEAADSLNNCLKLFAENKISKDNAWNLNIIDSFSKLIKKHHHSLSNFQVAGSTLEASTKVYSLRVDSVYADVLRMSTDLSKQTAKALSKKNRLNLEDNDEESDRGDDGNDKENMDANQGEGGGEAKSPKEKQKKKRRNVATVTKNPDTLNGRLDTHPMVDPFFAKLNSMVGDINSSKRLMQYILPTKESNLKLCQNMQIWDRNNNVEIDLNEKLDVKEVKKVTLTSVTAFMNNNTVLRNGLKSYRICEMPLENAEEADMSIRQNDNELFNQTISGPNASHMDVQFDINAEVEPIPNERSFVMDFGDMNDNDFDDVEEEQRLALNRCKGLKRQPILVEDMQPETSAVLSDYSYRPLDMIDRFWAGPSHWKFRQSRRTHLMSLASRASQASISTVSTEIQANGQRPKIVRKKKIQRRTEASLEDALNSDDIDTLYTQKGKSKNTQITVQVMAKRWDGKKLKLPTDHRIASDILDMFSNASSIHIATNPDATFTGTDNGDNYNYDNELDRNYCSRVADAQSDTETETNTDMGQMDNNMEFDVGEMGAPPPLAQIDEIPDFFVGAPDRIEKISIAFAKRAKVVDMKQLKSCSWNLISRKQATNPLHAPCFAEILHDLPKVLNKTMAENMSMPLAFYAVLHLCNDKGLILTPNENLRDFEISFV